MKNKNDTKLITNKRKIFNIFFGSLELPIGKVIITPINKIYQEIKNLYPLIEETKGWWYRSKIRIHFNQITLLKIPLGPHIQDFFKSLNPNQIEKIIFLGFCGSLRKDLKIGDAVILSEENYKIITVSQMILDQDILKIIRKNGIDLLDMETSYLRRWAELKHVPIITILIVTDLPESLPFFRCGKKELQKIDSSIIKIINQLDQYI